MMKTLLFISLLYVFVPGDHPIVQFDNQGQAYTMLQFPGDSLVRANVFIRCDGDSCMFKWLLAGTDFGDSLYYSAPGGFTTPERLDSMMVFSKEHFSEEYNIVIYFY